MAAIIQRLHVMIKEQMGLSDTFEFDCRTESDNDTSDSDGEQPPEGATSLVDDVCQPKKGVQILSADYFWDVSFASYDNGAGISEYVIQLHFDSFYILPR